MINWAYEDIDRAEHHRELSGLIDQIESLGAERRAFALTARKIAAGLEMLQPDEVDDYVTDLQNLCSALKHWEAEKNHAETERANI